MNLNCFIREAQTPPFSSWNLLVALVDGVDEDDGLAFDQVELEERVEDRRLVVLLRRQVIMRELRDGRQFRLLQLQSDGIVENNFLQVHDIVGEGRRC